MTKEEKQLLIKDLCARLPYGVKYCRDSWNYEWDQEMSVVEVLEDIDKEGYINYHKVYKVWDIKPYLRPMSSMTDEEREEWADLFNLELDKLNEINDENKAEELAPYYFGKSHQVSIDWLNSNYFDYRGLIPMGFAIEAPEGMYKTE